LHSIDNPVHLFVGYAGKQGQGENFAIDLFSDRQPATFPVVIGEEMARDIMDPAPHAMLRKMVHQFVPPFEDAKDIDKEPDITITICPQQL
jgi:hypothetical protein